MPIEVATRPDHVCVARVTCLTMLTYVSCHSWCITPVKPEPCINESMHPSCIFVIDSTYPERCYIPCWPTSLNRTLFYTSTILPHAHTHAHAHANLNIVCPFQEWDPPPSQSYTSLPTSRNLPRCNGRNQPSHNNRQDTTLDLARTALLRRAC